MKNGAVHVVSTTICNIISLSAEADIAAMNLNEKEGVVIFNTLEEMGHPKPETPPQTENSTEEGIVNITIFQRCSKAMDMLFYWLHDQENQNTFKFIGQRANKI